MPSGFNLLQTIPANKSRQIMSFDVMCDSSDLKKQSEIIYCQKKHTHIPSHSDTANLRKTRVIGVWAGSRCRETWHKLAGKSSQDIDPPIFNFAVFGFDPLQLFVEDRIRYEVPFMLVDQNLPELQVTQFRTKFARKRERWHLKQS